MPDSIGPIAVPEQAASGTFPLTVEYPFTQMLAPRVHVHRFLSGNAKIEQRFHGGNGARRWMVSKQLRQSDREALLTFWNARQGAYQPFTFHLPDEDGAGGTTAITVRFGDPTLTLDQVSDALANTALELVEEITSTPSYTVSQTLTRAPDGAMQTALLSQTNTLIPLLRIRVLDGGVADILLSDRRVTVGGLTYLPRILSWSGIAQSIGGSSDQASFTLGNADRVLTELANAVDLFKARLEFSVYHLETTTKLDLWAGYVSEYDFDEGEQFSLSASDGLYELNISYPRRKATRQCWKRYKDGINCTAASGLTSCNKSWDDCVARANTNQFGGILTVQEGVTLKDNSTGFLGLGRNTVTASSILARSENIYGRVLPEIFTDSDMPVSAWIMAGRDENEFYAALGIVGEGPLGAFASTGHLLDEQPNHSPYSPRFSLGASPSNPDLFNIDETSGGEAPYRAAGTAFLQIRRSDEKGQQLSRPDEHNMTAVVRLGRTGWVWSGPGARSSATLSNPIWVALNVFLRALGLENASASTQEAFFDVASAVAAAAVCDTSVTALVGGGSVTQFRFQGVLADEKPARDWLQEILNTCVGYFTFRFGKLKIGIRLHSGSAEGGAYGPGNIVMGSLKVARRTPAFNHLTVSYADREKKFAANSVLFYDEDHIAEHRESRASINLVGTSTADQALRFLTVRLREELGGAVEAEWKASRTIGFRTTVLGLATEPGQVCSLTHPDMPGGSGEFRLTGWRLNPDWSIDYEGVSTTDSMYDLLTGPKPGDVTVDPTPGEETPLPLIGCWHPGYEVPLGGDPLFDATRKRFTVRQSYYTQADEVTKCVLQVEGYLPVNRFVTNTRPILRTLSSSGSGGSLRAETDYYLQVACYDAAGKLSPPSLAQRVSTPAGGNTAKITVGAVTWPSGTWSGFRVYLSDNPHLINEQGAVAGALPASFDVTAHPHTSNTGVPIAGKDPRVKVKVKRVVHGGIIGTNLAAVGTGYFELGPGIIGSDDEFNGRICSVIADNDGEADIWNFTITDTVLGTNRLLVTPDPQALGIGVNDTLIIRTKASTYNATQLGDTKWQNGQYPGGNTNDETGTLLRIIGGTGKGQVRRVVSNTITVHTVDRPFNPVPDATTVWIIEEGTWVHQAESTALPNELPTALLKLPVEVSNYLQQSLLVLATLVTDNAESAEEYSPWREIWVYGQDALTAGAATVDPVTGVVLTSPAPAGWAANPDYWVETWAEPLVYVGLTYTPPADATFTGVDVWRKLSTDGNEKAIYCGAFVYGGSGNGKVEIGMLRPDADGTWLFHIASRSANTANPPDFSDSAATEPVALTGRNSLTAAITGATISAPYYNEESGIFWGPTLSMNLPSTNQTWSWCDWTVQWLGVDSTEVLVAGFDRNTPNPVVKIEHGWGIPSDDQVGAGQNIFRFRLYLYRLDGTKVLMTDPWGNGTPNKDIAVSRQLGGSGAENAPNVTPNVPGTVAEYATNQDGVSLFRIRVQMGLPGTKIKYGGLLVALAPAATIADRNTWLELGMASPDDMIYYTPYYATPAPGSYKIVLLAIDPARRENSYQAGVTPTVDLTIGTQPANLLLSRTKGKLTNQGKVTEFEGLEVKAPVSVGVWKTVAWIGAAIENASQLNGAHIAGSGIFFVDSVAGYAVGQTVRITHPSSGVYEEFVIGSINVGSKYLDAAYFLTNPVSFESVNAFPDNSLVQIVYNGVFGANAWFGGTSVQDAPFRIDNAGNVLIESVGTKHPALKILKNGITTELTNSISGSDVFPIRAYNANAEVRAFLQSSAAYFQVRYADAPMVTMLANSGGGSVDTYVAGVLGARISGLASTPASPPAQGSVQAANISYGNGIFYGGTQIANSNGVKGDYVRHRFFNATYDAAMIKAALRDGEVATWYDGANWLVYKHADGSGNAFKINNDGTL